MSPTAPASSDCDSYLHASLVMCVHTQRARSLSSNLNKIRTILSDSTDRVPLQTTLVSSSSVAVASVPYRAMSGS